MRRTHCERFAEARSAFVDGSIDPDTRDDLVAHLGHCGYCRAEVAELRRLRSLLSGPRQAGGAAPASLQDRLVSIAAGQEQDPLWTRPFRRVAAKPLPSRRRRRRRRAVVALTTLGTVAAAAAGVGYAAAPAPAAAIGDPSPVSRTEFAAALADQPLGSDSLGAVLSVGNRLSGSGPSAQPSPSYQSSPSAQSSPSYQQNQALPSGPSLTAAEAATLLRRSEQAGDTYGVQGVEQVIMTDGGQVLSADVTVESVAGQGSEFTVTDPSGHQLGQGFEPTGSADLSQWLDLMAAGYDLRGVRDVSVAGRSASVVEARRPGASSPAARWWLDDRTGVLLGRQSFDTSGVLVQSAMFRSVTTSRGGFIDHPAPRMIVPVATATMAPASGSQLSVRGWDCQQKLAGMPLTEVRTDPGSDPTLVHLIYGDGVWTVSVFERRGTLTDLPADTRWDDATGAYLSDGMPRMASWQSGEVTFTVVTDAPASTLGEVVRSLPHDAVGEPTTMARIAAGWSRIFSLTFG